jgi:hypothetical protein
MFEDTKNPILQALRRLPPGELEKLTVRAAVNRKPAILAAAVPEALGVLKAAGYSDAEIREELAQACEELGLNCG